MPKRSRPHNAAFQEMLHKRGMTLAKLAKQMGLGQQGEGKTHVHLCQVVNGRRRGVRTVARLREILPEDEWEVVRAFRAATLGSDVDAFLNVPHGTIEGAVTENVPHGTIGQPELLSPETPQVT